MLATIHACALVGIEGSIVDVEVDFNPRAGIPAFTIVGLPDTAVKESRERVRAAIKNSHLSFPNKVQPVQLMVPLPIHDLLEPYQRSAVAHTPHRSTVD